MDLYLIRHAEAKPAGEDGVTEDTDRPLTERGEGQARTLATGLQRRRIQLHIVLSSPYLRARQTAEGMLEHWAQPAPELVIRDELAMGLKPKKLARYLRNLGPESVGLVGHMPDLGTFAAWLIGNRKINIELAKAGVAYLECNGVRKGGATLRWLVTPEWLGGPE